MTTASDLAPASADARATLVLVNSLGTSTEFEVGGPGSSLDSFEDTMAELDLVETTGATIEEAMKAALAAAPEMVEVTVRPWFERANVDFIDAAAIEMLSSIKWTAEHNRAVSLPFNVKGKAHLRWEIRVIDGLSLSDEEEEAKFWNEPMDRVREDIAKALA